MRIVVLPGDGIGPEISGATLQVLEVLNRELALGLRFETHEIGLSRLEKDGSTFPDEVLEAARAADGVILGPVSHSDYPAREKGGINGSAQLRRELDLYANPPCPLPRRDPAVRPDSLGLGGAINAGDKHCVAQAQHGSAPDIQGQDKANPCSLRALRRHAARVAGQSAWQAGVPPRVGGDQPRGG
jgi:isocitrate/isopropylmalate dehydrogenase